MEGKAVYQGGRKFLHEVFDMPALVASTFNSDMKAKYSQLKKMENPPRSL
jgi:hypothetical protein